MITVLVQSPIRIYREGVAEGLMRHGCVVADTSPAAAGSRSSPDVVIVDVGSGEGRESVRAALALWPDSAVVALGVEADRDVISWAEAGVSGFVSQNASLAELARVVEVASRGQLLCSPDVAAALCRRVSSLARLCQLSGLDELTVREREIAQLIELGLSNKEIAARLSIQVATVKNHVHSILAKLGVRRRGEAAATMRRMVSDRATDQVPAGLDPAKWDSVSMPDTRGLGQLLQAGRPRTV